MSVDLHCKQALNVILHESSKGKEQNLTYNPGNECLHAYVRKCGLINKAKDLQFSKSECVKKFYALALNVAWILGHYC